MNEDARRFAIALAVGVAVVGALGVAVALSYHPVRPRILCAMPLGTGGRAVYFGYSSEAEVAIVEPRGAGNHVSPRGEPPTVFLPGSSGAYPNAAFVVSAGRDDEEIAWTLGPRTVRLDDETARCPIPMPLTPPEDIVWVPPKPAPEPPKEAPAPEAPPAPQKPAETAEAKPPPPPDRPVAKPKKPARKDELVAKVESRALVLALDTAPMSNLDGGMAIQAGSLDLLGEARYGDDGAGDVAAGGKLGGVEGGTAVGTIGDKGPARVSERSAAKVKVRPAGEWPSDAPPRAGPVLVRLSLLVAVDGSVKQVKVIRGAGPAFDREARAVGLRAVFTPATVDGQPVESWVPWDVQFTPDDF